MNETDPNDDAAPAPWTDELDRRARAALAPDWQGRDADEALRDAEAAVARVR